MNTAKRKYISHGAAGQYTNRARRQHFETALIWYRKAAGEKRDAFNLGTLYFNGIEGLLERNEGASLVYFEEAAGLGIKQACLDTATYLRRRVDRRDTLKALKYLGKAAEQGHIAAHYHLAIIYRNGVKTSKRTRMRS